jgi:hypothetical protein
MQQTFTVPYLRTSPLHDQRRDLVASASESLTLRVVVVESDNPSAQLLLLTGGIGGPSAQLLVWTDYRASWGAWGGGWGASCGCDYGWGPRPGGSVLWSAVGVAQPGLGAFDFFIPAGTLLTLPRRCGWAVQLCWYGSKADVLFQGTLNIMGGAFGPLAVPTTVQPLLTDDRIPVLEDDTDPVYA